MTRELKLALIVGFSLVLVVTVLISDHLSKARQVHLAEVSSQQPALVVAQSPGEPSVAVPPPSDPRVAARNAPEPAITLGNAPPAVRTDIVQGRHGGVKEERPEDLIASNTGNDPDARLIEHMKANGADVVDRGATREIVLKDPTSLSRPGAEPPAPAAPERTHTVVEGDTLMKIAKQYYGESNAWQKLAAANGGISSNTLKIGMKIKLPPSEQITGKPSAPAPASVLASSQPAGKTAATPAASATPAPGKNAKAAPAKAPEPSKAKYASYVVKKGDTITEIARRQLGSPGRVNEVLRLNESVIEDEDSLQTGMVLKLPLS